MEKKWKKTILAITVSMIIDIIIHALWVPLYNYDFPASYFVKNKLFEPAAGTFLLIVFIFLAFVFDLIQDKLSGDRISKGLRFGIAFGGLWFFGLIGSSIFLGSPLAKELAMGVADGLPLLILGVLLGKLTATDCDRISSIRLAVYARSVTVIAIFFIAGQYLAFVLIGGHFPNFNIGGIGAFLWTLIMGLWIGIMYCLLEDKTRTDYPIKKAFRFGGIVFGINWFFFNLFLFLIIDVPLLDPFILAGLNIVSVIIGSAVLGKIDKKCENSQLNFQKS